MKRFARAATVFAGLCLTAWLCMTRRGEVLAALHAVAPANFAAAVALHVAVLLARSEAWRVALAAVAVPVLPRRTVHSVNAGAFLMGSLQSQAAVPARVALLRREPCARALRPAQIGVADAPIFLLESVCAAVLLAAALAAGSAGWWAAPALLTLGAGALVGTHWLLTRFAHRPMARGLAVLGDRRRRIVLAVLIAGLTGLTFLRAWLVLAATGLPDDFSDVGPVFAALGLFGLIPLGPAGPSGATLATLGAGSVGAALAAGLVISASSIAAVLIYAAGAFTYSVVGRPKRRRPISRGTRRQARTASSGRR